MSEQGTNTPQFLNSRRTDAPAVPVCYLSSGEVGWDGLIAQAFHEPMELEGWITPAASDISLILFTGGSMRLARRHADGPWNEQYIRHGDLILQAGARQASEVRWKSLSAIPTQTLHLHLSQDLLARTAADVVKEDPTHVSLIACSGFQDPLLAQIGFALWRELEQGASAGKLYAQTAVQFLAMHLLRHYTSATRPIMDLTHVLTPQQLNRVTEFVHEYLNQDLSLTALAQQTGFSPYHFARLFRKTTGESPHQFVLRQRIAHAQCLLAERDVPLAQVALTCGFANQSHFTQAFKRQLGLTPRAYRQRCII